MLRTRPRRPLADRLARYGAMSVAAAAAVLAPQAQAGVVYHSPTGGAPVTVPLGSRIYFDLDADGHALSGSGFNVAAWSWIIASSLEQGAAFNGGAIASGYGSWRGGNSGPVRLGGGERVGPGDNFLEGFGPLVTDDGLYNQWAGTGDRHGFVGARIRLTSSPGGIFYGWAELTVHDDYTVTLHRWAHEDVAGVAIQTPLAADVPEPASILLLALGAAGLGLYRKRRAA